MTEQPRLHHLLDRMRRGVLLPAEGEQLVGLVAELERRAEQAERLARDRAARIDAITTDRATLRQRVAEQEDETTRQHARATELEAEVARLTRELADADADAAEAREHNEQTCEAVAERDRLEARVTELTRALADELTALTPPDLPTPPQHLAKGTNAEDCPGPTGKETDRA